MDFSFRSLKLFIILSYIRFGRDGYLVYRSKTITSLLYIENRRAAIAKLKMSFPHDGKTLRVLTIVFGCSFSFN